MTESFGNSLNTREEKGGETFTFLPLQWLNALLKIQLHAMYELYYGIIGRSTAHEIFCTLDCYACMFNILHSVVVCCYDLDHYTRIKAHAV